MADVCTYSVRKYGEMIDDKVRTTAYADALRRHVRPGSVVVDIGAGTGFFSLLACQLGARKVYAIEPGECIHIARRLAEANGMADRIEFLQEISTKVTLPERADVIVADLHGVLPLFEMLIRSLADARTRLLAPGGVMIPQRELMRMAPASSAKSYRQFVGPYFDAPYGLNMELAGRSTVNTWARTRYLTSADLVSPPQTWATLDYTSIDDPNVSGSCDFVIERDATVHGLAVWFDSVLSEGIGFSNAPDLPDAIYGRAFFPWTEPVALRQGDRVRAQIIARHLDGDYVWVWESTLMDAEGRPTRSFRQCNLTDGLPSMKVLHKRADTFVPRLSPEGAAELFVLEQMRQGLSLAEITTRLQASFPNEYADRQQAFRKAADVSQLYSL